MAFDNTDRGALFKNTRKTADTHADYNGSINVGGVEYWLNGWIKDGSKGKFFSLSVKPKEAKAERPSVGKSDNSSKSSDFDDDSIPF